MAINPGAQWNSLAPATGSSGVVSFRWTGAGANARVQGEGEDPTPELRNYYHGGPGGYSCTGLRSFARLRYRDVYPGIDVVYHGSSEHSVEFDIVTRPGANVRALRMSFTGARDVRLTRNGDLLMRVGPSELRQAKPFTYQIVNGKRKPLQAAYKLLPHGQIGFEVSHYNPNLAVVIDPVLTYSTYLGGAGFEATYAIAVDAAGALYATGETSSLSFSPSGVRTSRDVFVAKLNPGGTGLLYTTILGGAGNDSGQAIAVDSSGNAYVTGATASVDFPISSGAIRSTLGGLQNAFVIKLAANGSLAYSTYLGGQGADSGTGIALDGSQNVYITGNTNSAGFPTTAGAFGPAYSGGFNDVFITKLSLPASSIIYSTFLGGSSNDTSRAIAVDSGGNAYVAGQTNSTDFPVANAFRSSNSGDGDAFVTKLNAAGSALLYSTYIGGSSVDQATAVAVDANGSLYVTGVTASPDFPVTGNAYQSAHQGGYDAFVLKLPPAGNSLIYSTFLGGNGLDIANALAVDPAGNAWVAGYTSSSNFPVSKALQSGPHGNNDAFLTALNSAGTALLYSSYLGGSGDDRAYGLAVQGLNAFVAGFTFSSDFPTASPWQPNSGGSADTFVAKMSVDSPPAAVSVTPSSGAGQSQVFSFTYSDPDGAADITLIQIVVNATLSASQSCFIDYNPVNNILRLANDSGSAWLGGIAPQSTGIIQNSQCAMDAGASSVSKRGNIVTVNLSLSFKPAFQGSKSIYTEVGDSWGQYAGWPIRGTWTVPAAQHPTAVSVTPSTGTGLRRTFSFVYSEPSGASNISLVQIVFNTSLSASNACFVNFDPQRSILWLANDSGSGWLGGLPIGVAGTVQNNQCAIDVGASSVVTSGNNLTLNLALAFRPAFQGPKTIYTEVGNTSNLYAGWPVRGTWTVGDQPPAAVSVTPNSGAGSQQVFSFLYSDPDGASDITLVQAVINATLAAAGSCYLWYDPASNMLYLANDQGSGWIGGLTPGANGVTQNSQCSLDGASSSVSASGTNLTVNFALTFKPAFQGAKTLYTEVGDASGRYAGWPVRGSWTVQ